jgi:hypothetical protein
MKKKTKQSITIFIPVSNLEGIWKGDFEKLPTNQTFDLIINYPLDREYHFVIKTGKKGMGLIDLLRKIGKVYNKIYFDPDKYGVWGHDIHDLQLEGINVDFKTKKITIEVGS